MYHGYAECDHPVHVFGILLLFLFLQYFFRDVNLGVFFQCPFSSPHLYCDTICIDHLTTLDILEKPHGPLSAIS